MSSTSAKPTTSEWQLNQAAPFLWLAFSFTFCYSFCIMAVPKQHRSKSRQGQRRMHIYLKGIHSANCSKCGKAVLAHTVCENCGFYRGRETIDVLSKLNKKERKLKEREIASQKGQGKPQGELSPEKLSQSSS